MPRPLDGAEKDRLLEEFRACLDDWEQQDEGAGNEADDNPDPPVDLHTLLAEMAALKNEVRLESRQFKNALEDLRRLGEALQEHNERLARDLDKAREQALDAQRQAERRLLLDIVDLRDRLQAGVDVAGRRQPSRWARLLPGEARFARSLSEGLALTLQRLDEMLAGYRVRAIEAVGKSLDPHAMRAVGVEASGDQPDGVVLREARRGFLRDGELLRAAEVIVNKRSRQS